MGDVIKVSISSYINSVKQMYQSGEITLEQYASCLRRSRKEFGLE